MNLKTVLAWVIVPVTFLAILLYIATDLIAHITPPPDFQNVTDVDGPMPVFPMLRIMLLGLVMIGIVYLLGFKEEKET